MIPGDKGELTVAIQGEPGAFSHMAALSLWGQTVRLTATRSFPDLFQAVKAGEARYGVVPVENTLAGSVQGNLDLILEYGFQVVAETQVRIQLTLVTPPGTPPTAIRSAASHPVALQQCRNFFAARPRLEPVAVYDTAGSIRDLMAGDADYGAAIGSPLAARIYGAEVLEEEIEDNHENYTRFFAVTSLEEPPPHGPHKTTLAFVVAHEPGSLHQALGVFARRGLDLTKLESRPIPGQPWQYRFFADVRGSPDGELGEGLKELEEMALELRVLGYYQEWGQNR